MDYALHPSSNPIRKSITLIVSSSTNPHIHITTGILGIDGIHL